MRPYDALGRYGGEEFLLIVPGCDITMAWSLAEKVRESVVSTPVLTSAGPIPVTLTLFLANFAEHSNLESLLRSADDALYRGKKAAGIGPEIGEIMASRVKTAERIPAGPVNISDVGLDKAVYQIVTLQPLSDSSMPTGSTDIG